MTYEPKPQRAYQLLSLSKVNIFESLMNIQSLSNNMPELLCELPDMLFEIREALYLLEKFYHVKRRRIVC